MSCPHLEAIAHLVAPAPYLSVHREECTQCFDSQDFPSGIEVCLSCFNGACSEPMKHHAQTHIHRSGHQYTLNVKRKPRPSFHRDEESPAKTTKLSIYQKGKDDQYETNVVVKCWACEPERGRELLDAVTDPKVKSLVHGTMYSLSSACRAEILHRKWIPPCVHTLTLRQDKSAPIPDARLTQCASCDLKDNLWLCITCGFVGCGRRQHYTSGGNGHALQHWYRSMHPAYVKVGTITPDGGADVHCHACDRGRSDPKIATHLASFGINIQTLSKTDKTMLELETEVSLKYDFPLATEDGHALQPLFGPGLTGIANLANSSYIASILQVLFSLPAFQARYNPSTLRESHGSDENHALTCPKRLPSSCIECQLRKIADGLLSGRYAVPRGSMYLPHTFGEEQARHQDEEKQDMEEFQVGLKPWGLKALLGHDDAHFGTMMQQDAKQFLELLIQYVRRDVRRIEDPTRVFTFALEHRLWCASCMGVQYRINECDVLRINVPSIELPQDQDSKGEMSLVRGIEQSLGEKFHYWVCTTCKSRWCVMNARFKSFPEVLVLHANKLQSFNWISYKLDVPNVLEFGEAHVGRGIRPGETALLEDSSMRVRYRLKAFVSHKGPSTLLTHYVAHVRVPIHVGQNVKEDWVLFNDEKVVKADEKSVEELKAFAYLYFFERL